jgi:hypothetical protein
MNCKPGDLAVIIRESKRKIGVLGKIVEVLYLAPRNDFLLPDGCKHIGAGAGLPMWVVKFATPVQVELSNKRFRNTCYAAVADAVLRPIRDQPGEDESLQWAPVPGRKVEVPA